MKEPCRFCAEPVEASAAKCPHCGEALFDDGGAPPPKSSKAVILIVIVVAAFGFCAFVGIIAAIAIPNLIEARKHGNEAAAIGALKTISTSQTLFREGDKDGDEFLDYASNLQELSDAYLIDMVLGSGVKQGYVFQVASAPDTPEFLWMATASPAAPGTTGDRYFVINHAGVIYYSNTAPFAITPDCEIPPTATPVGR